MFHAPINLDPFRAQIELRIAAGQTHAKIREWLARDGMQIGKKSFSQRCVAWEASRYTRKPATDLALLAAINCKECHCSRPSYNSKSGRRSTLHTAGCAEAGLIPN